MPPKQKPSKKITSQQSSLATSGILPMLAKTSKAIGLFCIVPGPFWDYCPAADKDKKYKCIVTEFVPIHDFAGGRKGAAFRCKEMGENGEGSLEAGATSGEDFVIRYPMPFLEYFYAGNPDKLPAAMRPKEVRSITTTADTDAEVAGDGAAAGSSNGSGVQTVMASSVAEDKEMPPIFDYLTPVSSTLATSGPKRGQYTNKYTCAIACQGSVVCGGAVTLYSKGKSQITSNGWTHIREKALDKYGEVKCPYHKAVLDTLNAQNMKRVKSANGEFVPVHSFGEAFPHHVDYVWCRAGGIFGAKTGRKPQFRAYVKGYEPRAVFPHHEVQFNIALCIHELQTEERDARYKAIQTEYKGGPCIGLQLDMWTNTHTHISYAGLNGTTVVEPDLPPPIVFTPPSTGTPKSKKAPPQLRVQSEVIDFNVFPHTSHTGDNIRSWLVD